MNKFLSCFSGQIRLFILFQKASEHWNESSYEPNLILFDRYCKHHYPIATGLSQEMIDTWCQKRPTETNNSCRSRIYVVISFIRYLNNRNLTDCIEPVLPRKEARVYLPHAFRDEELENFFFSCDNLPASPRNPPVLSRRATIPVFFRLLYSSGLRTTEARLLRTKDVNLKEGVINVRYSKGHSQHFVVLHDSMVMLLQIYDQVIAKLHPKRTYFFPARNDSYHTRNWVQKNFRSLWDKYNSSYATAYELRHHYATTNINSWNNEGFGFHDKLLYLSKSMGHSNIESTKYYYSLVPRLSKIMETNTGSDFNDILPGVYDEED